MERSRFVQPPERVMVRSSKQWYAIVWSGFLLYSTLWMPWPSIAQETTPLEQEFSRGLAAYTQCNYTRARDHFRQVVAQAPDDAQALFYLGMSLGHLHAFDEARARLTQALALSPSDPSIAQVHYHLGWIYSQMQGHAHEAQYHFAQAQKEFPARLTHYYQGMMLYKLDCIDQAKPFLQAVLQEDDTSYEAYIAQRYYYDIIQRQREQRWWQLQAMRGEQFRVKGLFATGRTQDLTTAVTWASSNRQVAIIGNTGLATALPVATTTRVIIRLPLGISWIPPPYR